MYLRKTDKLLVDGSILKFEKTHSKLFLSILHSQKYYGILISLKYCGYHGITIKSEPWVIMGDEGGEPYRRIIMRPQWVNNVVIMQSIMGGVFIMTIIGIILREPIIMVILEGMISATICAKII